MFSVVLPLSSGPHTLRGGQVSGDPDSKAQACPGQNPLCASYCDKCLSWRQKTEQGQNQEQKLAAVVFYRLLSNEHE